jgi:phosphatidylserine decarboxylase
MAKIAPEGYPFIAVFVALTAVSVFVFGPRWSLILLVLTLFMLYFFRDPERAVPAGPGYVSPADGRVVLIGSDDEGEHLKRRVTKISIFMSVFDVHVNRAPCDAEVLDVVHTPGRFLAAYKEEASVQNENTAMRLRCAEGEEVLVRQVAGLLARRVVNRALPGDRLRRGERFGIIKFSSRVDVYLPEDVEVKVQYNDHVKAGETILAVRKESGRQP